jgi:hypothetical protein
MVPTRWEAESTPPHGPMIESNSAGLVDEHYIPQFTAITATLEQPMFSPTLQKDRWTGSSDLVLSYLHLHG